MSSVTDHIRIIKQQRNAAHLRTINDRDICWNNARKQLNEKSEITIRSAGINQYQRWRRRDVLANFNLLDTQVTWLQQMNDIINAQKTASASLKSNG